ncbi:MAG: hypothetical protein COV99_11735 [Bacteroidetes bacterium CG12_big_fil_rev_8_21_14_0_65_60_17]|nr:MAG: hypothetical protein COV99_11735 [Bacteroidetes bacterium CG12_big_fil_rev_8_21_14_0_65_60_17]
MDDRSNIPAAVGFYLWRGGLAFSAAYLLWEVARRLWMVIRAAGVPWLISLGVFLLAAGFILFIGSFILERLLDARAERGLGDL